MRAIKTRNNNTMTESEFFGKIRSSLRKTFQFWIPIKLALELASRPSQSTNKRLKKEYQCAKCKKWFARKDVEVDHIIECGSLKSYADIAPFIQRLALEDVSGFQVLCKKDHLEKTKASKALKVVGL